ncbi:hypothetical protein [Shewanella scandinavica]|uniref:hypothetical protein n=1 Tax=Shewanella scandinavica TaxID=3063538 RepID=UPI00318DA92B
MIINQTINNGFLTVNKTGAYFSLISAGGVVNVRLSEKGRVVLDTKMWVGMSIDKAIPFDEITIKGDDGAVEFWAGDVSMNQSRASIAGAAAIRTSQVFLEGVGQLTGNDVTRSAVRLRANKDIWVSGASFSAGGWKLPANEMIEIPVSGVINGFKTKAIIDIDKSENIGIIDDFLPSVVNQSNGFYISEDENLKLMCINGYLYTSIDGAPFQEDFDGAIDYCYHRQSDTHYLLSKINTNFFTLRKSINGINWTVLFEGSLIPLNSEGNYSTYSKAQIVNGLLHRQFQGQFVAFDIDSGEAVGKKWFINEYQPLHAIWMDKQLKTGLFVVNDNLVKTSDGGQNYYTVLENVSNAQILQVSEDGRHVATCKDSTIWLSNDAGETFIQAGTEYSGVDYLTHVYDDIWINYADKFRVYYILNGEGYSKELTPPQGINYGCEVFLNHVSGFIYSGKYAGASTQTSKSKLQIDGDLSPAVVEVMELLS